MQEGLEKEELLKKLQEARNAGNKNFMACGSWFRVNDFQESERGIWKYCQRVIVPLDNVSSLLFLMHTKDLVHGLEGSEILFAASRRKYLWSGLKKSVYNYVTTCEDCLKNKATRYPMPLSHLRTLSRKF